MATSSQNGSNNKWTPQQREEAVRMRADHSVRDISTAVAKSPKAVERFFERIGLTKGAAVSQELSTNTRFNPDAKMRPAFTGLKTTWGDPLLVRKLDIEFGHRTPVVPIVIPPDIHAGIEDMKAIELACKIVEKIKPVSIVYLGDNVDFTMLSTFAVAPDKILKAQEEIDTFHKIDRMLQSAAGSQTRRYWLLGNHEDRMYRQMCAAPGLSSFRGLQMEALFGLDKDWKVLSNLQIVEEEMSWRNRFIFKHGKAVSGFSA